MFIDSALITCKAGNGGDGCNSYEKLNNMRHRRPTGGDGGRGGDIILVANAQVRTLLDVQMRKTFQAKDGKHGSSNHMTGRVGSNERIRIPVGAEVYHEENGYLLRDMCMDGEELVVCRGGNGGKGSNRKSEATRGHEGETKLIRLELKLLADVGLVGVPNAGKSTLISRLSNAKSRIAAFPFTTKEPVLGVVMSDYGDNFVIADIPGLIAGASQGKGLGHAFLRHVERTKMFVHLIDMAGVDGRNPAEDYHIINHELESYSKGFRDRPRIVVANKMDVPEAALHLIEFKKRIDIEVFEISAVTGKGVPELVQQIFKKSQELGHLKT